VYFIQVKNAKSAQTIKFIKWMLSVKN
jgi:hypothetical protein